MWWLVAGKVLARPHPKAKAPSFYFPKMVGDKIQRRQKSYKRLKGIYSWESSGGPANDFTLWSSLDKSPTTLSVSM